MKQHDEQLEVRHTRRKAPYERPALTKVGRLRDVPAQATGTDESSE